LLIGDLREGESEDFSAAGYPGPLAIQSREMTFNATDVSESKRI